MILILRRTFIASFILSNPYSLIYSLSDLLPALNGEAFSFSNRIEKICNKIKIDIKLGNIGVLTIVF